MIRASDLNRYCFCPRSIYLTDVAQITPPVTLELLRGRVGHAVRHEISLRQRRILDESRDGEYMTSLNSQIDEIFSDLRGLMGADWRSECSLLADDVKHEVIQEARLLASDLDAMVSDVGLKRALAIVSPWQVDYPLESKNLGLTGRVDKVINDGVLMPVDIKTGSTVDWGGGDALQLCAYGMLIEDTFKQHVPYGIIEYTRTVEKKPVVFTDKLKAKTLDTRDAVKEIIDGVEPPVCPHGEPKKCEACNLKDDCYRI